MDPTGKRDEVTANQKDEYAPPEAAAPETRRAIPPEAPPTVLGGSTLDCDDQTLPGGDIFSTSTTSSSFSLYNWTEPSPADEALLCICMDAKSVYPVLCQPEDLRWRRLGKRSWPIIGASTGSLVRSMDVQ